MFSGPAKALHSSQMQNARFARVLDTPSPCANKKNVSNHAAPYGHRHLVVVAEVVVVVVVVVVAVAVCSRMLQEE